MRTPPAGVPGGPALLARPALQVAPVLLGAVLVHDGADGRVAVRLTEVEAYEGGSDPGSHAFRGPTPRTATMVGPAGHLYVYRSYGVHWCVNIVCGPPGTASAVLVRAGEVVEGTDLATQRRPTARVPRDLARGPARLTRALGITGEHDGARLLQDGAPFATPPDEGAGPSHPSQAPGSATGGFRLVLPRTPAGRVRTGPRVGVSGPGGDGSLFPWRFWLEGEPSVSPYRAAVPRRPRRVAD